MCLCAHAQALTHLYPLGLPLSPKNWVQTNHCGRHLLDLLFFFAGERKCFLHDSYPNWSVIVYEKDGAWLPVERFNPHHIIKYCIIIRINALACVRCIINVSVEGGRESFALILNNCLDFVIITILRNLKPWKPASYCEWGLTWMCNFCQSLNSFLISFDWYVRHFFSSFLNRSAGKQWRHTLQCTHHSFARFESKGDNNCGVVYAARAISQIWSNHSKKQFHVLGVTVNSS